MKKFIIFLLIFCSCISFGAEHSKKLKYRKGTTTTEIKLYTTTTEVGDDRLAIRDGSTTVYAKIGAVGDAKQSDLRIRDGSTTKSILLSALPTPYLVIVGEFTHVQGVHMPNIAKYQNETFSALNASNSFDFNGVYGMDVASNTKDIYVGGRFSTPNKNCARVVYGQNNPSSFGGTGLGVYSSSIVYDVHTGRSSGWVYYVGVFPTANGVTCNGIAAWNPASGTWQTFGSGFATGGAFACTEDTQGNLYVAGTFTSVSGLTGANYIAKWTRSTNTWSKMGGGFNNYVHMVESDENDNIYATGVFTTASGTSAVGVAMWEASTSTWKALKGGIAGVGSKPAISVHPTNGKVYFGGSFDTVDGTSGYGNIAQWNPSTQTWSKLTSSGLSAMVHSRFTFDGNGNMYVGGEFTSVNGTSDYNYLAKWNPTTNTWSKLGTGVSHKVHGLKWVQPTE